MKREKALKMAEREIRRSRIALETEMQRPRLPKEMYDNLVAKVEYAELIYNLIAQHYRE